MFPVRIRVVAPSHQVGEHNAKSRRGRGGLTIVGKTKDGKLVVQGVFEAMSSTTGLPLEVILEEFKKQDMVVDWVNFCRMSVWHGWKWKTVRERLHYSLMESHGPEYRDEVLKRVEAVHSMLLSSDDPNNGNVALRYAGCVLVE